MLTYVIRRLLYAIVVLFGVTLLVFITLRLTGDPVQMLLQNGTPTKQDIDNLRHAMHLDQPLYLQYISFITGAVHGDFGNSLRYKDPAFQEVMSRMPATLELAVASYLFALVLAIPSGILSAVKRGGATDLFTRLISLIGISFPNFWLGLMLILLFGVWLKWLPVSGRGEGFVGSVRSLVMPAVTLGLAYAATLSRLLRSSMLEVLHADFVRTARAKGLRDTPILVRHALRNALIPVVTLAGLQIGFLLGGAVIVEVVFSWPGVGRLVVDAINNRDYPIVQAAVTLLAAILILANLTVDLLYAVIDPRIHYS
ncbi:MAG TPA: nickel ABC transporter permease [Thermomicrobiaceae bacterium]|nr:nickel ABC transporter permease [Thermomicrobiaceae bacterium]